MAEHEHEFGECEPNVVRFCRVDDCTEIRTASDDGAWRELTGSERRYVLAITITYLTMRSLKPSSSVGSEPSKDC